MYSSTLCKNKHSVIHARRCNCLYMPAGKSQKILKCPSRLGSLSTIADIKASWAVSADLLVDIYLGSLGRAHGPGESVNP